MVGMSAPEPFEVPADAPVVIHRQGRTGRPCVAVIVEAVPEGSDPELSLRRWRLRLGGWMTRAQAAEFLGLSVQRVDQLRRENRLTSRQIGDVTAIDAASVSEEWRSRSEEASGE